jgi:hypothetical protein
MSAAACRGWLLLLSLVACDKSTGHHPRASASADPAAASASPLAVSPPAPSERTPAPLPTPTCRALRVSGEAQQGEAPLASGAQLDGAQWVTLGAGASLTLKHTLSGREIAIAGPATFRACGRGRERVLLARGKVQSGSGMSSRPGAEVLIATPVGTVRYADADFTLALDEKRLSVEVRAGQVQLDPASDTQSKGWKSALHAKDKLSVPLGKPDAAQLMARCQAAAEAAESTARRVGDRNATEPLGERAQAHVRARKTARAACTIAASATGLVADSNARAGLWAEAVRWEGLWETIPRPRLVQPAEK